MLPIQEKIARPTESAFHMARRRSAAFGFAWHQHPELELTLIEAGRGQRFVGDHIGEYEPGDLVLIGADLPHTWASHPHQNKQQRAVVVQFHPQWIESVIDSTPEARSIRGLINRSRQGLSFKGPAQRRVAKEMPNMLKTKGMQRALRLLAVLDDLSRSRGVQTLSSPAYGQASHNADDRIDRVCRFIHEHVSEPITQADAAELIHMSGPAFSRFFKRRVGKTYIRYVHELRIGHACRLLLESDVPVIDACFASGFNNLSNFNRVFKSIKGTSPKEYRFNHDKHTA